ncbi:hypoxanthine phosphoribosyltransferase [Helcococcus sueciensis]|uniref:hypoxanthine phosphoribosyltransferase n=1 Tax=Helcococcus sueciensis TaxID=241555 RepID=UPI000415F597|nr:hypoxanthine phosphoribosyltransferase [Helcococcus sueciensis]
MDRKKVVLFEADKIKETVKRMGQEITEAYKGETVVAISLLRGSFVFAADLVREIKVPTIIDFMTTSSYGDKLETSGRVDIVHDLRTDLKGQNVLIIDDICDSGHTLKAIINFIKEKNPKSVKTAVFLDKPSRRLVDVYPEFIGEEIEDLFVVGYGLNYGNYYRNCPYIFAFMENDENK